MTTNFELANSTLLQPAALSSGDLENVLSSMVGENVDFADLFFQRSISEGWVLEDGIVKEGSYNIGGGVGVRAVSGDKTGFSYSDDISLPLIQAAAKSASGIAKSGKSLTVPMLSKVTYAPLYTADNPLDGWSASQKIELLKRLDSEARRLDSAIKEVTISLAASWQTILIAASDGVFAADVRPLFRLNISVIAEKNGRRERAGAGGGGRFGYLDFDESEAMDLVHQAVRMAQVNLESIPAPAGTMPVVLGPGWPGVLLHEAVGHGLEGDFNRKGSSAFSNRIGQQVASTLCTVVDDGTLPGRRGSLSIDDEGTATQNTVLIENGILKGYMQDKMNAKLMGHPLTGNGRRESYAHLPMPRMRNTYMLPGQDDPADIIRSVKKGLYAVNFGGGQVDITSGKFVFSANEAYLIEDGKITAPVKGATLIGNGPAAMQKVSMLGHDLALDRGVGVCGKEGQSVPVGVGQPTLKIDELTVGGTQ